MILSRIEEGLFLLLLFWILQLYVPRTPSMSCDRHSPFLIKTLQPMDHPYLHRGTISNYAALLLNAFLLLITTFVSRYFPLLVAMIYLELYQ